MNKQNIINALNKGIENRVCRLGGEDQDTILEQIKGIQETIIAIQNEE